MVVFCLVFRGIAVFCVRVRGMIRLLYSFRVRGMLSFLFSFRVRGMLDFLV